MTRFEKYFEKYKKDLTIEEVCNIFAKYPLCKYCPTNISCASDDSDVTCEEFLKEYLEQESESEVENEI